MSDLFSADQASQPQGTPPSGTPAPVTEQVNSPFAALVGEQAKYKTPEELAKAYLNADQFIEQLKSENAELRKQATAAKSIDEVLEQLQQKVPTHSDDTQGLTADQVASIVQQQITGIETAKTRQANLSKADKAMKEKFGDKAVEVFQAKANTPQLKKIYQELAEVDPDQFVALFGVQQVAPQGTIDTPSVNSASAASAPRVKEWSKEWVAQVRKENPSLYKSQQFQQDMMKNADKYFN